MARTYLIKCHWKLHNARVAAFTVSELLRENQQRVKLPFHPPRLGLNCPTMQTHFLRSIGKVNQKTRAAIKFLSQNTITCHLKYSRLLHGRLQACYFKRWVSRIGIFFKFEEYNFTIIYGWVQTKNWLS